MTTEEYPDEPAARPQYVDSLCGELVSMPSLDVDQQLRVEALHASARAWTGVMVRENDGDDMIIATARVFEVYIRGDQ